MTLNKNKIIIDCSVMKNPNTGLHNYCRNLCLNLLKYNSEYDHLSFTFYIPNEESSVFFPKKNIMIKRKWHKYLKTILFRRCKIWHVPFQNSKLLIRKNANHKILVTVHDLNFLYENNTPKQKSKIISSMKKLLSKSDKVVCISNASKKDLLEYMSINEKDVKVIYNGAENYSNLSVTVTPTSYKPTKEFLFSIGFVNPKKKLSCPDSYFTQHGCGVDYCWTDR